VLVFGGQRLDDDGFLLRYVAALLDIWELRNWKSERRFEEGWVQARTMEGTTPIRQQLAAHPVHVNTLGPRFALLSNAFSNSMSAFGDLTRLFLSALVVPLHSIGRFLYSIPPESLDLSTCSFHNIDLAVSHSPDTNPRAIGGADQGQAKAAGDGSMTILDFL
jgi:hypothetical protein